MNITSFIKERRKQLHLTQPELAMRAEMKSILFNSTC